jgi:hypothetical protein
MSAVSETNVPTTASRKRAGSGGLHRLSSLFGKHHHHKEEFTTTVTTSSAEGSQKGVGKIMEAPEMESPAVETEQEAKGTEHHHHQEPKTE